MIDHLAQEPHRQKTAPTALRVQAGRALFPMRLDPFQVVDAQVGTALHFIHIRMLVLGPEHPPIGQRLVPVHQVQQVLVAHRIESQALRLAVAQRHGENAAAHTLGFECVRHRRNLGDVPIAVGHEENVGCRFLPRVFNSGHLSPSSPSRTS